MRCSRSPARQSSPGPAWPTLESVCRVSPNGLLRAERSRGRCLWGPFSVAPPNSCHTAPVVFQEGGPWGFMEPASGLARACRSAHSPAPRERGAQSGVPPLTARHLLFSTWNVSLDMSGSGGSCEGEPRPGTWPPPCPPASRPTGLCVGRHGASKGMYGRPSGRSEGAIGRSALHPAGPFTESRRVASGGRSSLTPGVGRGGGCGKGDSLQAAAMSERGQSP